MDPYQVLGVDGNDSLDSIKATYHKLILKHHPDKMRGKDDASSQQFMVIQQAWKQICEIENDPSTYKTVNSDEISFTELILEDVAEQLYVKTCRCGESYEVYAEDLLEKINTFQCNGCTLYITVCDIPDDFFVKWTFFNHNSQPFDFEHLYLRSCWLSFQKHEVDVNKKPGGIEPLIAWLIEVMGLQG